jgi:photosystem II stability/assembly factor-like uncharacterized protein
VVDSSFGTTFIYSVAYSSALTTYVAVGSSGKIAVSTDNTVTWSQVSSPFGASQINSVTYGSLGFVAVAADGKIASSSNGTAWTLHSNPFVGVTLKDVIFASNIYVAVGVNGQLGFSVDSQNWSLASSSFDITNINSIGYGPVNSIDGFILAGAEAKIATSAVSN